MDVKAVLKNVTKKILRIFYECFLKIISFVFKLFPLKERVCFYSIRGDGKLLDNAKSVYDKLNCDKIIVAHMLPHSHMLIPKIYFYLLTSKVIVTDDYLKYFRYIRLRKKQKVVQIWHACGAFKKFGLDAPLKMSVEMEKKTHSRYDAVCVSSVDVKKYYASAFGIEEEKVFDTGVARTDLLFDKEFKEKIRAGLTKKYEYLANKKIYLFAPTFREKNGKYYHFDLQINFGLLSKELKDDEVFVLKRHPVMKEKYFENCDYHNIFDLSDESVLELTSICDTLITDYSSVIFEAVLMRKKIVFYCPDYNLYDRDFYIRYPEDLPGEIVTKDEDLLKTIRETKYSQKAENFRAHQLSSCDGKSAERTASLICKFLKEQ